MNWFVFLNGIIYIGAAGLSFWKGNPVWAAVWFAYGASAFGLFYLEG